MKGLRLKIGSNFFCFFMILAAFTSDFAIREKQAKKVLMVIAPTDFRDEEFSVPKGIFETMGAKVIVASKGTAEAKGVLGMRVRPDLDVRGARVEDYAAIVFVGGNGVDKDRLYEDKSFLDLAKEAYEAEKVIGAICLAPKILANTGILEGKNVTAYPTAAGYLREHGANYTGRLVEQDGKIVTGSGPEAAKPFGERVALLAEL